MLHRLPAFFTGNRQRDTEIGIGSIPERTLLMKFRITFTRTEIALTPVFLRLACQEEGRRTRAVRYALPMLLETGRLPGWFTSMPTSPDPSSTPRSLTVRISLASSDPSEQWVINRLSSMTESDRATWIKTLMAKSLDVQPNSTSSLADATPLRLPMTPRSVEAPAIGSQDIVGASDAPHSQRDNPARQQLFRNALKTFQVTLGDAQDN
ncbi:MAG: hypothetical protein KGZ70_13430 [Hydrogenophaga sp.]|nr:hypothetical protein [Hydrogenophaga sp.]